MAFQPYSFGSFVFHDGVNYLRQSVSFSTVEIQQSVSPLGRFAGVKKTGELTGERVISIQIVVKSNATPPTRADLEAQIDRLQLAMNLRQQPLTLHNADGRYFIADCTKVDVQLGPGQITKTLATLTFRCQQPYAFSANELSYDSGVVVGTFVSGISYFFGPGGAFHITSAGTIYAPVEIIVTNSASVAITNITVVNDEDSQAIHIPVALSNTDFITIQGDPTQDGGYTVLKNNTGSPLAYTGMFPTMRPTDEHWSIYAQAPSGTPSIRAQFFWTPRYLS